MRPDNLTGQKFGRLTGIERVENIGRVTRWLWQCDCGNRKVIAADKAKSGHTVSCGCYAPEVIRKHGHAYSSGGKPTRTYRAWVNMRSRVDGVTESYHRNYTLRGITVCDRWRNSFSAFLSDMGECPDGLTLERQDNDGDYEPGNCQWDTQARQNSNKRNTRRVVVAGETLCVAHACRQVGVLYDTAIKRIANGMSPQDALDMRR